VVLLELLGMRKLVGFESFSGNAQLLTMVVVVATSEQKLEVSEGWDIVSSHSTKDFLAYQKPQHSYSGMCPQMDAIG
jgi:hypothetical protein